MRLLFSTICKEDAASQRTGGAEIAGTQAATVAAMKAANESRRRRALPDRSSARLMSGGAAVPSCADVTRGTEISTGRRRYISDCQRFPDAGTERTLHVSITRAQYGQRFADDRRCGRDTAFDMSHSGPAVGSCLRVCRRRAKLCMRRAA